MEQESGTKNLSGGRLHSFRSQIRKGEKQPKKKERSCRVMSAHQAWAAELEKRSRRMRKNAINFPSKIEEEGRAVYHQKPASRTGRKASKRAKLKTKPKSEKKT